MKQDVISYSISILGVTWSVTDLSNVISLILLIVSLINILYTTGFKIYNKIKSKKYKEIGSDIQEAKEELENLKDKIDNKEEE